ncbi:hypothetical protein B5F34_07140 [Mediterranea sp. An20]|nr:hypothetical protein B5F34_07140 [Mediterranea sp. An20]
MVLSSKYNFSLGFVPAIVAIVAGTFIAPVYAACMGGGIGLVFCFMSRRQALPFFLLYGTTVVLLLLSVVFVLFPYSPPGNRLPILFEGILLLPPLLLLALGNRWVAPASANAAAHRQHSLLQGAEAAIVSARIVFILALIHGLFLLLAWLAGHPVDGKIDIMLYKVAPPGVFAMAILLNQAGIVYFNRRLKRVAFVPVVNTCGEIVGKKPLLSTILRSDKEAVYPIVRIAVTVYGMLYLLPRSQNCLNEAGKTDLPVESFLIYGESVEQAARRAARHVFPKASLSSLCFNFKYYYHDDNSNRLVYLFLLELDNDAPLLTLHQANGKLWPIGQISRDLGKGYFSKFLEQEFEPLKEIICTREKYREF